MSTMVAKAIVVRRTHAHSMRVQLSPRSLPDSVIGSTVAFGASSPRSSRGRTIIFKGMTLEYVMADAKEEERAEEKRAEEKRIASLKPKKAWEFDVFGFNPKNGEDSVTIAEAEDYASTSLIIKKDGQTRCEITADRDQWGTWITLSIRDDGHCMGAVIIGQEDGTRSFIDALIAGLTELKLQADVETLPPTAVEFDVAGERIKKEE